MLIGLEYGSRTADFKMSAPPNFDAVRLMLRPLLMERFKLAVHTEDQPVSVWTLVVSKRGLKLKEADPASRSGCKPSMGESGAGSGTEPVINCACQNTTMAQLVEGIRNVAGGNVDRPAVDPSGSIIFFDAIEKQLGLRLESGQKHSMPVLVIDHVDHLTEN